MKVFAENRKARNSYEFLEFFDAGVVLTGPETKSARNGGISIIDAFATIEEEEAVIREMNIEPYKYADLIDYDPKTPRIRYDQFPLIACVGLFRWGFRGINYHWPGFRNYDWQQSIGNLYQAFPMEINDLRSIPYQNFKINN